MSDVQKEKSWWEKHVNLRERWKQATTPDNIDRSRWLSGSSFFAAFLRWPALLLINTELMIHFERNVDKDGYKKSRKELYLDKVNLFASAAESFVIPATLFVGSMTTKFITADIGLDDRAMEAAEKAIAKLQAATGGVANGAPVEKVLAISPEDYALHHSFIRNIQAGKYDAESVDLALRFVMDVLNTGIERACADNKTRKIMGQSVICSKPLEHVANRMNETLADKVIYDDASHDTIRKGELVSVASSTPHKMSLEEKGEMVRSLLNLLEPHIPMATDIEIMRAEGRIRQILPAPATEDISREHAEIESKRTVNFTAAEMKRQEVRENVAQLPAL